MYDDVRWVSALQAELDSLDGSAPIELVRAPDLYGFELLQGGAAHVVIAPVVRPTAARRTVHLFDDELVGVVSCDHPLAERDALAPADFDGVRYVAFSTTPEAGFENERFLGPSRVAPKEILRVESTTAILGLVATSDRITILSHSVAVGHSGVRLLRLDPPPAVRWSMSVSDVELGPTVEMTIDRLAAWWSRPGSSQVTKSPVQPDIR